MQGMYGKCLATKPNFALNAESQPRLLQVFDLAGRMLATKAVSTGSINIELPSRGVFLVRSRVGTRAETKKIIIN